MHLILAGLESYDVRRWGKNIAEKRPPAETSGILLGYLTHTEHQDHVVVEHVSTDTFARGTSNEVALNKKVTKVKLDVIRRRWPHLSLVGDFHTHVYQNYQEVVDNKGWEFSKGDYDSYGDPQYGPDHWDGRCALVLTIAELKRIQEGSRVDAQSIADNVIHWQVGDFRFWLSAYAIDHSELQPDRYVISPPYDRPSIDASGRQNVYIDAPTINGTSTWFQHFSDEYTVK